MLLLSVVMAVKNGEKTIHRAVGSILSQTFAEFEFLIADDFSADKTVSIINGFEDKRIKIVRAKKQGLVPALNFCLQQVKGKYIARMDADDFSYPDRFQLQLDLLEKDNSTGVVSGGINHVSTQKNQDGYANHVDWLNLISSPKSHFLNRFKDAPVANPSVMFRTSILDDFGLYREYNGPEDYEFWLRLLHYGVQFKKVKNTVLDWYDYSTRLTRNSNNYSTMAFAQIRAKYFSLWWNQASRSKNIWIWGYGKEVFHKSSFLNNYSIEIGGYIDIIERPNSSRKVITHDKIVKRNSFILVYVSERTGQENIQLWLENNNFKLGEDFYFMS
jgi:glycosyltransferase involved in cell wall biosynthesis